MVITGKTRQNGKQLGNYLVTQGENERIEVLEVSGATTTHVPDAVQEFSLAAELTRGRKGLYHATIDPAYGEDGLTPEQWRRCADVLGEQLGLQEQPRVIVLHHKKERTHAHVVWQRARDGRLIDDAHSYARHDQARAQLEVELKHQRTHQPQQVKNFLTSEWQAATSAQEFYSRITASGFRLAQGERRPYIVQTPEGLKLDLVRQLAGVRTAEVQQRLADLAQSLPQERELAGRDRQSDLEQLRERRRIERTMKAQIEAELGKNPVAGEKEKRGIATPAQEHAAAKLAAARKRMNDIKRKQRDQDQDHDADYDL